MGIYVGRWVGGEVGRYLTTVHCMSISEQQEVNGDSSQTVPI